jgi:galactokinase
MDQLASLCGRAGHALLVDCRDLSIRPIPIPAGLAVVAVNSGLARELADSEYAARRAACETAAARLGIAALRDARPEQVTEDPRARHVVSENERVLAAASALAAGELAEVGRLMHESHVSLRDDYEVSTPELDFLVESLESAGALGARLTGAGFGGCVVAAVHVQDAGSVAGAATARYRAETGLEPTVFLCRAVDGASLVVDPETRTSSDVR